MKLKKAINGLTEFKDTHGNIPCYYASDPEGNGYYKLVFNPSVMYRRVGDDSRRVTLYTEEDTDDYPDDKFIKVCVVN